MTTDCLPCEQEQQRLARQDIQTEEPATDRGTAEWSGPIGIENQRTGDGRFIEPNALRWDTLPIPLRWAMQDFGAHDGAYVVGKIEEIDRIDYAEANERLTSTGRDPLPKSFEEAVIIWGAGTHDLGGEYGREAYRQVDEGLTPGISMDLDDIVIKEEDGDSFSIVEGRVRAATQVAIPAFEGARVSVSKVAREAFDSDEQRLEDTAALVDEDGSFNWVDDVGGLPPYIKRIEKHLIKKGMAESHAIATAVNVVKKMCATGDVNFPGAQQVNAGSRAEACAAVADWEEKKARAKAESGLTLVASAGDKPFNHEWFQDPRLKGSTAWTVTDEGRVYGYVAMWGTCHIANPQGPKVCTQPPHSYSKYAYFNTQPIRTDTGFVHAGRLTMNTLHAGQRLSSNDTIYHYEHTGAVGAFVVAGEDEYGIWVAGAAHPKADLDALRAAPVSGDWRTIAGNLEMVATLSVNVPGFPIPRATALVASGEVQSLVASGMVEREERHEAVQTLDLNDETTLRALRARFADMDRVEAAATLAAKVARLDALERVRRVSLAVGGPKRVNMSRNLKTTSFAYNPDQWRVPKGNPEGGRWVDMPGVALNDLEAVLTGSFDDTDGQIDDIDRINEVGAQIGESLDKAKEAAERADEALRNNDGEAATAAAKEAQDALDSVENKLQSAVDERVISENVAPSIGDALENARTSVDRVADSDLSLLGDEGVGGDVPETDIGGESKDVVGDTPTVDDPMGEDPLSVADVLGEAGLDGDVVDHVATTGWIQNPEGEDGDPNYDDQAWDVLNALPEGTEIVTGQEPLNVNYVKDSSIEGGWRVSEIGPGVTDDMIPGIEVGGGYGGDPTMIDGGGDNDIYIKGIGDGPPPANPDADVHKQDEPAVPGATAEDKDGDGRTGAAEEADDVFKASDAAVEASSALSQTMMDAIDSGGWNASDEEFANIGEYLQMVEDMMQDLQSTVRDGTAKPDAGGASLSSAKKALQNLEALLMSEADKPGAMDDNWANQIGTALDNLFDTLGRVEQALKGSTEPPPFAARKYVRQWLGRRGIRLGRTPATV